MNTYILNDKHEAVPCEDMIAWGKFFSLPDRFVKQETVRERRWYGIFRLASKPVSISTVFLGMDHNFDSGAPILFETMVFGGRLNGFQQRYSTWREAVWGHEVVKKKVLRRRNNALDM